MCLVPRGRNRLRRSTNIEGAAVNPGGREVKVQSDSVDDAFVGRVTEFVRKMSPLCLSAVCRALPSGLGALSLTTTSRKEWNPIQSESAGCRQSVTNFKPTERHTNVRLCCDERAVERDISTPDKFAPRDSYADDASCPDCQEDPVLNP